MTDAGKGIATLAGGLFPGAWRPYSTTSRAWNQSSPATWGERRQTPVTRTSARAKPATQRWSNSPSTRGRVSFKEILEVFFVIHDPTTLNRQGNDVGTQYRSAIFHHSAEQKAAAEQAIKDLGAAKIYDDPIVTEVVPPQSSMWPRITIRNTSGAIPRSPIAPSSSGESRKIPEAFSGKTEEITCTRMSAVQSGARKPRTDRRPIRNPLRTWSSWERPSCCGVRGRSCPGATLTDGSRTAVSVIGAAGFAAAFPADFPALRFSTAFPSAVCGFSSDFSYLLLLFLRCLLAFLFFAITSLHQKLKKQSTAPVRWQRAIHRRDEPDSESFLSPGGRRATRKIIFSPRNLCCSQSLKRIGKNFQQHWQY